MSKTFFLVDPHSGEIRRESDFAELDIILRQKYRRSNPPPPEGVPAPDVPYALNAIGVIEAASPEVCQLTEFTSVCYREPPKEERPRS